MLINCAYTKLEAIHKLQPNPKNPNKHPARQIELLAKIIDYQGQRNAVVVSSRSGFIVKGHGRLEAIKKLGWKECAVDIQDYESEAQEYADMIADNKIAELAEHDDSLMINEIKLLELDDLELLGLDGFELSKEDMDYDLDAEMANEKLSGDSVQDGLVKYILIEFDIVDYEQAYKLTREMRKLGYQLGNSILQMLRKDYEKIKPE